MEGSECDAQLRSWAGAACRLVEWFPEVLGPEFPRYTHVHYSCKHRFIALIAARLQGFLCTWAIAPANHIMGIHQGRDIHAIMLVLAPIGLVP